MSVRSYRHKFGCDSAIIVGMDRLSLVAEGLGPCDPGWRRNSLGSFMLTLAMSCNAVGVGMLRVMRWRRLLHFICILAGPNS